MKITLVVAAALVGGLIGALAWMGVFQPVRVQEQDQGPFPFVYVQEASSDSGKVREHTQALGQRLDAAGFTQRKPAQIWYPAGQGAQNQIGFVVDRTVGFDLLGADTFFRRVPVQRCLIARFPYKNPLSFALGQLRVEPALQAYRRAKGYGETHAMVILEKDAIVYLQPVAPG
jgi:hypothetical protein